VRGDRAAGLTVPSRDGGTARDGPAPRRLPRRAVVGTGVVVVAVAALLALDSEPPGEQYPDQGNAHLVTPDEPHPPYNSAPPSSGPHWAGLARFGSVFEEPLDEEVFVHNLEDGGIVFTYDCPAGCDELVAALADLTTSGERRLLTPYSGIVDAGGARHRAAAVAWTRVLYLDELDAETMSDVETFVDLFEGIDHH
jgi:hypothetical protein